MWTLTARAELPCGSQPYASSLTDSEWALIAGLLPDPSWHWPPWAILGGFQYLLRIGCAWRHLPLHFRPWSTIHC